MATTKQTQTGAKNMTKVELASLYTAAVNALCARYPKQSRAHYMAWLETARVGRTTKRIRSKGGFTDIAKGTFVLYAADEHGLVVWAPRPDGEPTSTLTSAKAVKPVCAMCEGSGMVQHKTGLLALDCPAC
jgi:hypothetical protein